MQFVGIDLAERHSAAVIINEYALPTFETTIDAGAQEKPPNPWKNMRAILPWWLSILENISDSEFYFVVETPYFHARNAGPALTVQGGLLMAMTMSGIDECHLITPLTWQKHFGYSKKEHGDSKTWATGEASARGFVPAMTWETGTKTVKKQREDLTDAFLLAAWLQQTILG